MWNGICTYVYVIKSVKWNVNCIVTDKEDPEKGGNKQKKDKQMKSAK